MIVLSASQFEQHARCVRLWWFKHVLKLPEDRTAAQSFGTIFAGIMERFLKDEEPFPPGWEEGLFPYDQDLIRRMFKSAKEHRAFSPEARKKIKHVEPEVFLPLLQEEEGLPFVTLIGYPDVVTEDGIDDHKTRKSFDWNLTQDELRQDIQMTVYAKLWLEDRRSEGLPDPPHVDVRHHNFLKSATNPMVSTTRAFPPLTPREIDSLWEERRKQAQGMRLLHVEKKAGNDLIAEQVWPTIPAAGTAIEALHRRGACGDYGGCKFGGICSGGETPSKYREGIARVMEQREREARGLPPDLPVSVGGERVSGFGGRIAAAQAAAANGSAGGATATASSPSPAPQGAPPSPGFVPASPKVRQFYPGAPPWAHLACSACVEKIDGVEHVTGITYRKGDACRICNTRQRSEGKITSDMYDVIFENGQTMWQVTRDFVDAVGQALGGAIKLPWMTGGSPVQGTPAPSPASTQTVTQPVTTPSPPAPTPSPPAPTPAPPPAPTQPAGSQGPSPEGDGKPEKAKKVKFYLHVNCGPRGGVNGVISLDKVYAKYAALLAEQEQKESVYEIDAFRRRDMLASAIPAIIEAEKMHNKHVVARTDTPDMKAFVNAFAGVAEEVWEAFAP